MSNSYIKSLRIESVDGDSKLSFVTPDQLPTGTGAINVICGENGVGKSYIVRSLEGLSTEESRSRLYQSGYHVEFTIPDVLPEVSNIEPWRNLSFAGQMFFDKQSDFASSRDQKRIVALSFWFELVSAYFKNLKNTEIPKSKWLSSFPYRKELFAQMDVQEAIGVLSFFRCSFVEQFEQLFNCEVGIRKRSRKVSTLEITMDTDFGFFPFQSWSQGQKTVFNFLQVLHYSTCNVFLIDEIENNLHPKYISKLLRSVKASPFQFIITSHHPHVIFSKFIDTALFIERITPRRPRRGISYESENKKTSIARSVYTLDKAVEKVRASYQLFDEADAELLQQASYVKEALQVQIYSDLFKTMEFEVKPERKSIFPDGQSSHVSECLRSLHVSDMTHISILDFGSGLCRVANEFRKISTNPARKIEWVFWEPNVEVREKASKLLSSDLSATFLNAPPDPQQLRNRVDLILISNVLHELSPDKIAESIRLSREIIAEQGYLVVNELYPLLEFEEKAVPLQPEEMKTMLVRCGFDAQILSAHLRKTTTYIVVGKSNGEVMSDYLAAIESTWQDVLSSRLAGHGIGISAMSPLRIAERVQDYASIASIAKYFASRRPEA